MTAAEMTYRLLEGYGIVIQHFGAELRLVRDEPTGGGGLCAKPEHPLPLARRPRRAGETLPGPRVARRRRRSRAAHRPHQPLAAPAPFAASAAASRTSDLAWLGA
jgi:hypothetical protein